MKKIFLFVFMILWTGSISFAQGVYSIVPPQFQTSSSCQTSSTNGANIFIKTNPAHASLYINHVYVGETPICVSNLAPGTYLFRLSATPQYLPFEANIEVLQNQNQTFSWKIHLLSPVFETKLMPQGNNASTLYVRIERKAEAWLKAGIEAMKKNKLEEAERDFQLAATGKPQGLPIGYALLGMLYKQQGKTKEAVADFRQYLFFNPHSSAAYNELGKLYEGIDKNSLYYKLGFLTSRIRGKIAQHSLYNFLHHYDANAENYDEGDFDILYKNKNLEVKFVRLNTAGRFQFDHIKSDYFHFLFLIGLEVIDGKDVFYFDIESANEFKEWKIKNTGENKFYSRNGNSINLGRSDFKFGNHLTIEDIDNYIENHSE